MKKKECKHEFRIGKVTENKEYGTIYVMLILYCEKCGESKTIYEDL